MIFSKFKKITIEESGTKKRIDKFLAEEFPEYSRSFWQKLIKDNLVLVNNKKITSHYKLELEDKIKILKREVKKEAKEKEISLAPDKKIKFEVIFENDDFLIINKPAGISVHPSESDPQHTLVNGLLARYPELKNVGENSVRPGIVHRLDKDVSGVMVVAKTQETFLHLKEQFKTRKVDKEYLVLVHDYVGHDEGEINLKIRRSKRTGLMTVSNKEGAREAKTLFWIEKRFKNFTLLKVKILTGRTHQIRVHSKSLGHPVAGDKMYFIKKYHKFKVPGLKRVFLHSHKLSFRDRNNKEFKFVTELPKELKQSLNDLKIK